MPESKISDDILEMIKNKSEISLNKKVQVIISLDVSASLDNAKSDLAELGLEIENAVPGPIPFISGSILLRRVPGLLAVKAVIKIEHDSKVYAL